MAACVCPWWLGYRLVTPLRKLLQDPHRILAAYVREGMTVLEPGPGMGFFTLELARLVGPGGKIIAVDVQPKMLNTLMRRARRAGLSKRIIPRQPTEKGLGIEDYAGQVDFVLAFAVVHELPSIEGFFKDASVAMKTGGKLLLAEPTGHVNPQAWAKTLEAARHAGLQQESTPTIKKSLAALLNKEKSA